MSTGGTWQPSNAFEVIPLAGQDVQLQPGDTLFVTYDLFQTGDWYISYVVGKLEQALQADGRFMLSGYSVNEDAMTITVDILVLESPTTDIQKALEMEVPVDEAGLSGYFGLALFGLLGITAGTLMAIAYTQKTKELRIYRTMAQNLDATLNDPAVSEETKQAIRAAQAAAAASPDSAVTVGEGLGLIGVGLIGLVVLLIWKGAG